MSDSHEQTYENGVKASDLFVKALENEGVEYIFAVPGEENLDLLNSLKNSSIKLILTRHEQGAGFMAATYGRLTGKAGVCMATLGPGATNLVTPAAYAQLGAMPMFMITGQKPIKKSKQGRFQIIDVVDMMRPISKFTHQLVNGNRITSMVREAFRLAQEERPGAAHIEFPEDIAAEECTFTHLLDVGSHRRPEPDEKAVINAAKVIEKAKRPLLLIGAGANRHRTSVALRKFVDDTGIPFFNTQMGKGVIDERHEKYLGTAALSDNDYLHCAINRADLIINVGHDVIEKPPFFMEEDGCQVIHVNHSPASVDPVYFPQHSLIGDIAQGVEKLGAAISDKSNWEFDYYERVKDEVNSHISKYFQDERFPMLPQRLVSLLRNELGDEDIIALDNGVYKIWFARNYPAYAPNTVLLDNALASMGAGLPSAMMAKMLNPDKKVVAVVGDGGFMMNSQELETATRLGLDLVVIILNDSAYGMIKWKQEGMGFDDYGLDYNNPDFIQYARSYGAEGHRPESDAEFQETLTSCLTGKGVHVIDLPVDYSLNHPILNVLLKEKSCLI